MVAALDRGFFVREPAWHGLGTVLAEYPGREKAMQLAGHDWSVIEKPIAVFDPEVKNQEMVSGWKALLRSDTRKPIACQTDKYQVVQNSVLWDIVDAIVGQPNVKYETAGVLQGGAVLWVLAWLDEPTTIKGDDSATYPFCLVSTTHDGSGACKASAVSVRVVCWNTWSAANMQSSKSGLEYTFRHTKNVGQKIEQAKQALRGTRLAHSDFVELSNKLADIHVGRDGVKHFLAQFIPEPDEKICTDLVRENIRNARAQVASILDGRTIADAHRGTALGLLNAGIEYLDHVRNYRSAESHFRRCMYRPDRLKAALVALVRQAASV